MRQEMIQTEQPLISVIIPIYNMEQYLPRCLDSVLGGTYRNLEVICVDDGSGDGSLRILRDYEARDSRIKVIAKENGGVSSARNAGLDCMTGEYVSFIDPDDFVHPQYIELLVDAALKTGCGIACCGHYTAEENDPTAFEEQKAGKTAEPELFGTKEFFKNHDFRSFCWGKIFRSELLAKVRFRDLKYTEDSVFVADVWSRTKTGKAAVLPVKLYGYFQRENSLGKIALVQDRFKAAKIYAEEAAKPGNDAIYLDQAVKRSLSTRYLARYILPDRDIVRGCSALLKDCRKRFAKTDIYSRKEKLRNSVFIRFPRIYWLYRSVTETDMRQWELVQRKKRREAKKNGYLSK